MAVPTFVYGTEAQILALTEESPDWIDQAFYYPNDQTYFYQVFNDEMKRYGGGEGSGTGIRLNDAVLGGVKRLIEYDDILEIPEHHDYNTFDLTVDGIINCDGQINLI